MIPLSKGPFPIAGFNSAAGTVVDGAAAAEAGIVTAKETGEASVSGNAVPFAQAASAPPGQLFDGLEGGDDLSPHLLTPGETPSHQNSLGSGTRAASSSTPTSLIGVRTASRWGMVLIGHALSRESDGLLQSLPGPQGVDLITSVLPFDRAALDRAIDQFFRRFEDLDEAELVGPKPTRVVLYTLAIVSAFAGLEIVRTRWKQSRTGSGVRVAPALVPAEPIGFPQLPGSWSRRSS